MLRTDNVIPFLHSLSVRGRQTVARGPGDDGGEIECKYLDLLID